MKPNFLNLVAAFLVLFSSACARKSSGLGFRLPDPQKPQFTIAASDLAVPATLGTNSSPTGANATFVIHLQFGSAKADGFRSFTRDHVNQQTQLVIGSNVVAEPFVRTEITDGRAELAFSSLEQARAVQEMLSRR